MTMARNSRVLRIIPLLIAVCFCLSGCLEFKSIEQPSSILPGETFTVFIEATTDGSRQPYYAQPYFGICLPNGWTIPGDALSCTGVYNETIIYDSNLALEQESLSPSPEGYYWWVGVGNAVDSEAGSVYGKIQIQTDNQIGRFSIDYMVGYSEYRLNKERSDIHLIEVVDEYTPRELQAVVEGDTVSLRWVAPFVSEGLIGYNVYRDGQIINTDLVLDTIYVDENPAHELVCYTISSLYDNDDIHFMLYEIKVLIFSGGTGDPNDPYRITAAVQLASFSIADFPYLLDKCFVLVNDIDLDPNLPGGQVFDRAVIAPDISELRDDFQGNAFTGKFDGNGFKISNLTIVGQDYLGLIGTILDGGQVLNLGVVDVNVVGRSNIGILAGDSGDVTNCYSTGLVSGRGLVGGLVGMNDDDVANCYSTGLVSGRELVGGLVGGNRGHVAYCYSTGSVYGERDVGGLMGWIYGTIVSSFWDIQTSGQTNMCGSQEEDASGCDDSYGKTTAEMQTATTYLEDGWDFVDETANGTEDIWWILEGQNYPRLSWEAHD